MCSCHWNFLQCKLLRVIATLRSLNIFDVSFTTKVVKLILKLKKMFKVNKNKMRQQEFEKVEKKI